MKNFIILETWSISDRILNFGLPHRGQDERVSILFDVCRPSRQLWSRRDTLDLSKPGAGETIETPI